LADELHWVRREDRDYVAAEMTAFLLAWLTVLHCPVVNRPTAMSLNGPNWRAEQWLLTASSLGVPTRPAVRRVGALEDSSASTKESGRSGSSDSDGARNITRLTVVGASVLGRSHEGQPDQAVEIARAGGVLLASMEFENHQGGAFCGASVWPDVRTAGVADALLDIFNMGHHAREPIPTRERRDSSPQLENRVAAR
jgi:hypothetical protein